VALPQVRLRADREGVYVAPFRSRRHVAVTLINGLRLRPLRDFRSVELTFTKFYLKLLYLRKFLAEWWTQLLLPGYIAGPTIIEV
jgi:hypothetical protein